MHKSIFAGLLLALAAGLTIPLGALLDLDIESVALLGLTAGAVVALVPDTTPGRRLAAFALGFLVALVGYFLRAALMPDTSAGRAMTAVLVIGLCVGVTALAMGRLALWGTLLGAATLVGGYEAAYAAAPPRVVETALSTSTGLLLCVAVGFVVSALFAPGSSSTGSLPAGRDDSARLDDLMEVST